MEITLETERLLLSPMTDDEIRALIVSEADPEMRQAYTEMLQGCLNHPDAREWNAVWRMARRDDPAVTVGDFCFKGLGADGMVEIGYGMKPAYYGRGYMTEAVRAASLWASRQAGVRRVEAETAPDNIASQRVLTKAGYRPTGVTGAEGPRYVYAQPDPEGDRIDFLPVDVTSPDAQLLIGELNARLTGLIGNNGSAHVNFADFSEEGAVFLVGYRQGQPTCCAGIRRMDASCGEVKRVYARPNRIGAGARLMAALEQWASGNGYTRLKLECRSGNPHAIGFYQRNGYRVCENYEPYIGVGDAVCLEKELH